VVVVFQPAGQINIYSSDSDEDSFTDDEKPRKKSLKARKLESDEVSVSFCLFKIYSLLSWYTSYIRAHHV